MELLLELPDGSKSLIPASWTDIGTAGMDQAGSGLVTLGSLADLLRVCQLIADLRGQAAGMSPCKEDSHAACPAQFDTRPSPTPITGPVLVVELTPMVEQLPTEAVATAITLLANVIAKAAAMGSEVVGDE
jgi:hypothetical protein